MKRHVKVALPCNLNRNDICDFKNRHYDLSSLKVIKINGVIITSDGICMTDNGLIKESIHGYRDKITIYSLKAKLDLLNNPTFQINDTNFFLIIHSPLFNYYYWLTESIPRLLLVKKLLKDLTLILPAALRKVEFVQASLKPLLFKDVYYIPSHTNIKVKHLVLPQIKPYYTSFFPEAVNEIRNLYTTYSQNHPVNMKNFKGRTFLCNEKVVSNISEVRTLLEKHDFVYTEIRYKPFYELIQLMNKTKVIISVDSDNLACINFMKKSSSLLELIIEQTCELDKPSLRYQNLASSLELRYFYQICSTSRRGTLETRSKIRVDLKLLEENINLILISQPNSVN